jgi:hypothetical protein
VAITRRDTLDNILCSGARHPGEGAAANYLYRNGVRHLLEGGNADSAGRLLTDIEFLVGRLGRIRSGKWLLKLLQKHCHFEKLLGIKQNA